MSFIGLFRSSGCIFIHSLLVGVCVCVCVCVYVCLCVCVCVSPFSSSFELRDPLLFQVCFALCQLNTDLVTSHYWKNTD